MTAMLTRPAWTLEYEIATFDRLIAEHAPHLSQQKQDEPRLPANAAELEEFYAYHIAEAAQDLFIVQVCAKAIDRLMTQDPDIQLFLSRQLGDDGAHVQAARARIQALSGKDPIEAIQKQVQQHWYYIGSLPFRNWLGFLAFELHYEVHSVAMLLLNSRLARINDPETSSYAITKILPDKAAHRFGVVAWWQREYDAATLGQRSELAAQLLELDEELQRRRNSHLRDFWQRSHLALGVELDRFEVIYDAWRREVLSYFLNIPAANLPVLVSLKD